MQNIFEQEQVVQTLYKQKVKSAKKVKKIAKGLIKAQKADKENYGPAIEKPDKAIPLSIIRNDNREPFQQIILLR